MRHEKKKTLKILNTLLFAVFAGSLIYVVSLTSSEGFLLNREDISPYNEGWMVSTDTMRQTNITLPFDLEVAPGTPYSIERVLTAEDISHPVLRIRSSMMNIEAMLDDETIYSLVLDEHVSWFHIPFPSSWHLIHIPADDALGKTLRIIFSSDVSEFSGTVNPIYIGTGEALLFDLMSINFPNLFTSLILIFLGSLAIFLIPWGRTMRITKPLLYLGMFALQAGLWILSESTLLQLFVSNRVIIASASYILNLSLPLTLALYIRDVVLTNYRKVMSFWIYIFQGILLLNLVLQATGIRYFISTTIISITSIGLFAAVLITILVIEGFRHRDKKARDFFYAFLIFALSAGVVSGLFIAGIYSGLSSVLSIGVLTFFLLISIEAVQNIRSLMREKNEAIIYKHLAFQDYLTKGLNRTAFERDADAHLIKEQPFRLVLLDLNYLKQINDTYGHGEGDFAIVESHRVLKEAVGSHGTCYRISGDEFAVILDDIGEEVISRISETVEKELNSSSQRVPYNLELALGHDLFMPETGLDFKMFYHTVDTLMYEHKRKLKRIV